MPGTSKWLPGILLYGDFFFREEDAHDITCANVVRRRYDVCPHGLGIAHQPDIRRHDRDGLSMAARLPAAHLLRAPCIKPLDLQCEHRAAVPYALHLHHIVLCAERRFVRSCLWQRRKARRCNRTLLWRTGSSASHPIC